MPDLVEYLEQYFDMHYQTEIVETAHMDYEKGDGIVELTARGGVKARVSGSYPRPMFQVLPVPVRHITPAPSFRQVPCVDCGNFARSWNCEAHTYWTPVGDEDDESALPFRTAFPDSPVMRNIQAAIADEGMATLNQALVSGPRRRLEPRDE